MGFFSDVLLENILFRINAKLTSIVLLNDWVNEIQYSFKNPEQLHSTLIRVAFDFGKMDEKDKEKIKIILENNAVKDEASSQLSNYIDYITSVENKIIKNILSGHQEVEWETFSSNIANMKYFEIAAYYGLLKAYSDQYPEAASFCNNLEKLFKR